MLKRLLLASSILALAAPAGGAMAQDYYGYDGYYAQHARDHQEHGAVQDGIDEAHAQAHGEGFYSRREHRAYHHAQRDGHNEFHQEHAGTRHDGYRLPSRRGGGSYGYQLNGGYPFYGSPGAYNHGATYNYDNRR